MNRNYQQKLIKPNGTLSDDYIDTENVCSIANTIIRNASSETIRKATFSLYWGLRNASATRRKLSGDLARENPSVSRCLAVSVDKTGLLLSSIFQGRKRRIYTFTTG